MNLCITINTLEPKQKFTIKKYMQIFSKIPKDDKCCAWLSLILIDSIVFSADKKCYPQIFLEECKHAVKKTKIINIIDEELDLNESDDDGFDESDEDQKCANRDKMMTNKF